MPTPPSVPFFERHPSKWMTSSNWALLMRNCLRYLAMPWVWEKQSRGVFFPPVNRHGIWKASIGSSNDFPIYGIWKPLFIGDCQFPCLIARGCLRCTENFNQTQFWAEKKTWKVTISIDVASHSHDMPWLHPRVFFFCWRDSRLSLSIVFSLETLHYDIPASISDTNYTPAN